MDHSEHAKQLGESIQAWFHLQDNDERLSYLSWQQLTDDQKGWWFSCAQYALDRE